MGQQQTKPEKLVPGAHILRLIPNAPIPCYHHGIYIGGGMVIHFLGPLKSTYNSTSQRPVDTCECKKCGHRPDTNRGVVKTCLSCFRVGQPVYIKLYIEGWTDYLKITKIRPKPPDEVVRKANELLKEGFGKYKLLDNNCGHFAAFCKCGWSNSGRRY